MAGFFNPSSYEKDTVKHSKITQCGKCGLLKKCYSPKMEMRGSGRYKILFVGEAPGEEEDRQGIPFVGQSGQFLEECLAEIGFEDLHECLITNAIICRPPNNKIEPYMISCCRPSLMKTIKKEKPNVIVTLGVSALESILHGIWLKDKIGTLSRWVGWNIPLKNHNVWLCPTFHPAYLLRNPDPVLKLTFKEHLKRAFELETIPPNPLNIIELEKQVEIIKSSKLAKKKLLEINKKKGYLAFDYETTGLKPERKDQEIVSVSFCLNGKETFAFMMKDSLKPALKKVLRNKNLKKIASNLKFEERWTRRKLGYKVRNWYWDTMLMAHCIDNRSSITSIKFQAFVLLGSGDYDAHIAPYLKATSNNKNRIKELNRKDLLIYNGLDSLLEYLVMKKQKEIYYGKQR